MSREGDEIELLGGRYVCLRWEEGEEMRERERGGDRCEWVV
jgi:hypothetical protein